MAKIASRTNESSGTVKTLDSEPTPFPYVYRGLSLGDRRGQSCELILGERGHLPIMIRFEDGFTVRVPRYTVRRKPG
jgi:hypothetical protein